MAASTLYEILDVSTSANAEEITASYRRLAFQVHPDRGGNKTLFHLICTAYDTLCDTNRRAAYDAATFGVANDATTTTTSLGGTQFALGRAPKHPAAAKWEQALSALERPVPRVSLAA